MTGASGNPAVAANTPVTTSSSVVAAWAVASSCPVSGSTSAAFV
jgi:hypothetical protein